MKDRHLAGFLALFLGGIGVHKFYIGRIGQGFLYLLFCWTYIPLILSIIDAIYYFRFKSNEEFTSKVCQGHENKVPGDNKIDKKSLEKKPFLGKHPKTTIIVLVFIGMVVAGNLMPEQSKNTEYMAKLYCQTAIEMQLKDETSAQYTNEVVNNLGDGQWEVSGKVSAKNSFNARVNSPFYCKVQYVESKNGFNLLDFKISEKK